MKHTVRHVELDNGAKGLVIHAPGVEVVRILTEFHAGFDFADHDKYELPHVMEHTMFTNKTYPKPRQFSQAVEKNGAFNNAYTNGTSLEYEYECAAFEAERIADLIAIQLTEPIFPAKEVKTELGNVAEELSNNISSPSSAVADNLRVAATGVPSLVKRRDQLSSITDQDLHDWFKRTHTAKNMRFIVAGDIDFDQKILPKLELDLPAGERLEEPHVPASYVPEPVVESRDIPQAYYLFFSNLGRKVDYREIIAARIIVELLSNGFSSTLWGGAREKGLVYGFGMGAGGDNYETTWRFGGAVSPENAEEFFRMAEKEIGKAQKGEVSQKQFEATKTLMRGERARQYQRVSNLVNFYDMFFTIGFQEFDEYERLLDEIDMEEAVAAFNNLFQDQTWGASFVGNVDDQKAAKYRQILAPLWNSTKK